jgi:hypothetical protein
MSHSEETVASSAREWWWSQIPKPLQRLLVIASSLFVFLSLLIKIINSLATLNPVFLEIKNWIWPSPVPPQAANLAPPPDSQPPVRTIVAGVFEGYVYYEVGRDGKPTSDGQLKPANGATMPQFSDIHPGYKLKTISPVNIRSNPNSYNGWDNTGFNTTVGVLSGGVCVKVVEGQARPYPVQVAASGGFLPIIRVSCQ